MPLILPTTVISFTILAIPMENHRHTWNLVSEFGELFSACCGCNATVKKWTRITGWDHVHSKDHQKRNRMNKKFEVRIQIWIFQRTKNGYSTVIRTVRIRYAWWNGSAHSFGILGSCQSCGYAWIVIQRKTHGELFLNVKSSIRIRVAIFSMLWLQRCCEKAATNNWVGPHSSKRS